MENSNQDEKNRQDGQGKRFNQGKNRVDLAPAFAQEEYCRVLTAGANKYGDSNWRRGMPWSNILASLERHLLAIKKGEDYDSETGLLHSAHLMCNAAFLTEYYKIYPQGDNRLHSYLTNPRIGLVIDGLLTDYNEHWLTTPLKTKPGDIPFEPACYITSHGTRQELAEQWIKTNGFSPAPVYIVKTNKLKVDAIKIAKIDIFVEYVFENFVEINNAGICCYLFDTTYNRMHDVGHKRIYSLKDLV